MAFMPSLVATRHVADMHAKCDRLTADGKEKKIATTAVLRNLLLLAIALLRDQRNWVENMAWQRRILLLEKTILATKLVILLGKA